MQIYLAHEEMRPLSSQLFKEDNAVSFRKIGPLHSFALGL